MNEGTERLKRNARTDAFNLRSSLIEYVALADPITDSAKHNGTRQAIEILDDVDKIIVRLEGFK